MQITDIQMAPDRTYFITCSKDKNAKAYLPPHGISVYILIVADPGCQRA